MNRLVFAIFAVTMMACTMMACTALATGGLGVRVTKPLARRTSSGHAVSSNVLKLKKGRKAAKSSAYLNSLRATSASNHKRHDYGAVPVINLLSAEYVTEIAWNGIPVNVLVDTGSSDSWLVQDGFTCVDENNRTQPVGVLSPNAWESLLTVERSSKLTAHSAHLSRAPSMVELSQTSISI